MDWGKTLMWVAGIGCLLGLIIWVGVIRYIPRLPVHNKALNLDRYEIIDLTHAFDEETLYWPTSASRFELEQISYGQTEAGYFYAANTFCMPEHGGTHLDAPIHFAEGKHAVEQIPLTKLMGPAVVLDVSAKTEYNPDYQLTIKDVEAFEELHGKIAPNSIILLYTGWSHFWPDAKRYMGDDKLDDVSKFHFPSYGPEAARFLISKRNVSALGVDTASIDIGQSKDFMVHQITMAANVPAFENLTNLDQLSATGTTVIALPMKIKGGSGSPLRAVALIP
ncbi:MAG: cyclase family protein [Gammaproteobacteria bacterium]